MSTTPSQNNSSPQIARLLEFLSIPSIGTDPAFDEETHRCAEWVAEHLRTSGLTDTRLLSRDGGHPCVVARTQPEQVAAPDAPHILFYGHYDVQPPDPLDLWQTAPFEPTIRDGIVFARGASDDKGQVLSFLEALRQFQQEGKLFPCPITVVIEGEEESKPRTLPVLLDEEKVLLNADVALVSDTTMWESTDGPRPAITCGLRGLTYFEVRLDGPHRDLHSGVYGGTLPNPATQLTRILGKLVDDDGRIQIPGIYDDVAPITDEDRAAFAELGFDEQHYLGDVGSKPWGEKGFSTLERRWCRPSLDINGLTSGYQGKGAKTVIPAYASAKLSLRIPGNMNPTKVEQAFDLWFKEQAAEVHCKATVDILGHAHPFLLPLDNPYLQQASIAIESCTGRAPALVREGATIPVIAEFKQQLGLNTLMVGFGLNSDAIHSPNEHFALERFELGTRCHVAMLESFGDMQKPTCD